MNIKKLTQAIGINFYNIVPMWNDPKQEGENYYRQGMAFANRGAKQDAIEYFQRATARFQDAGDVAGIRKAKAQIRRLQR